MKTNNDTTVNNEQVCQVNVRMNAPKDDQCAERRMYEHKANKTTASDKLIKHTAVFVNALIYFDNNMSTLISGLTHTDQKSYLPY